MAKLDTAYGSFKELISVSKVYSVPLYQRRYSWRTTSQVAELWGDIVRLYRERISLGAPPNTHFIGSIVVGDTENKALGAGRCNIIDGQQRLTTLSLMLAAIRDAIVPEEKDQRSITDNFLQFPGTDELRLSLSKSDAIIYEQIVRGEEVTDKASPIFKTYTYIVRLLEAGFVDDSDPDDVDSESEEYSVASEGPEIESEGGDESAISGEVPSAPFDWKVLLQVIAADLELVSISGVPTERAYQIFATLNHGGLKLSQVDLTRNAVFMKLPTLNVKAYNKIWQPLEEALGEKGMQRFLHSWVIRRGHNAPQKDTYSSFLAELKTLDESDVYSLLEQLKSEADVFHLVYDANSYIAGKIAKDLGVPDSMMRTLKFLARWGNTPAQPILTEVVNRWKLNEVSTPQATKLLRFIESLMARRFIMQIPPNDLRSTLARLVIQVANSPQKSFEEDVLSALLEDTRRWPSDDELEDGMVTKPLYRPKNVRQTFLVLRRLAEALEGKEAPYIELGTAATKYSVEHILPQTVEGTDWMESMTSWGGSDPHFTWNNRRHTTGNLTLTAYNSELSNLGFDEKKDWIAAKLKLQLSAQILEQSAWTKTEIEARSASLAELAKTIWPKPA